MHKEISIDELKKWISQKKDFQLIDVREPYEFEEKHIGGARLMPLGTLQSKISLIDKKRPAVFVCRSGSRSFMAAEFAKKHGFDAYNLIGGMLAWKD